MTRTMAGASIRGRTLPEGVRVGGVSAAAGDRLALCLLGLLLAVYSTQPGMLLIPSHSHRDGCGCPADCVCRDGGGHCTCRTATVSLGARCGCGGGPASADAPAAPFEATLVDGPTPREPGDGARVCADVLLPTDPALGLDPPNPP